MQLQFPITPDEFTRSEQMILEYIGSHTDEFLFLPIGQISAQLGLSDATLSRFARRVGCRDFKALKSLVMEQSGSHGPAVKLAGTLQEEGGFSLSAWIRQQQLYLEKTLEQIDETEFNRAVTALSEAQHVFIHGKNASSALARLLSFRLRRLGLRVTLLPSGGSELIEGLSFAEKDDLVVLFNFSKLSREGRILLDYQKEIGYQTLCFTSRTYLPEEQRADINLFAYRGSEREYHSLSAPTALTDALVVAVSERRGTAGLQKLSELHRLKKRYFSE